MLEIVHEYTSWIDPIWKWASKYKIDTLTSCFSPEYNQSLETIEICMEKLLGITELELNGLEVTELPKEIVNLKNLTLLSLNAFGFLEINSMQEGFDVYISDDIYIEDKKYLVINNQVVVELLKTIYQIKSLKNLSIRKMKIEKLPYGISNMSNLSSLSITSVALEELPSDIVDLTLLKYLDVQYNPTLHLPESIVALTALKSLELDQIVLNKQINLIKEIRELDDISLNGQISRESIKDLKNIPKLKSLFIYGYDNLEDSFLEVLPPEIGELINLELFEIIGSAELKELPPEIGKLKNLTCLALQEIGHTRIPKEIGELKNLKKFVFIHPWIEEGRQITLPVELYSLVKLEILELGSCTDMIDKEISNLVNLKHLSIYDNNNIIKFIPEEIISLTNIETLEIGDSLVKIMSAEQKVWVEQTKFKN